MLEWSIVPTPANASALPVSPRHLAQPEAVLKWFGISTPLAASRRTRSRATPASFLR